MSDYTLTRSELTKLKAALTRAKRSGDPIKIQKTVQQAFLRFETVGYPDCWQDWQRAEDDAWIKLQNRR